jgi:dsRNA-specific ribonuclease/ERCC4-related helicase
MEVQDTRITSSATTNDSFSLDNDEKVPRILSLGEGTADTAASVAVRMQPRPYQMDILEQAKRRNIIAFIDTGGGKTLIAAMLIEHVINRTDDAPKLCIFVVNNKPLGVQQFNALRSYFENSSVKIGNYNGSRSNAAHITLWDKKSWQREYGTVHVMVITADLLLNCLRHAYISMSNIGLLVFDECHHARKSAPMALIMKEFYLAHSYDEDRRMNRDSDLNGDSCINSDGSETCQADSESEPLCSDRCEGQDKDVREEANRVFPTTGYSLPLAKNARPKILGLTASPVSAGGKALEDPEIFKRATKELEMTLDAIIVIPDREEVRKYIARPKELTRFFRPVLQSVREKEDALMDKLQEIVDLLNDGDDIKEISKRFRVVLDCLNMLGGWCAVQLVVNWINTLMQIRQTTTSIEGARLEEPDRSDRISGEHAVSWTVDRINRILSILLKVIIEFQQEYFPGHTVSTSVQLTLSSEHSPGRTAITLKNQYNIGEDGCQETGTDVRQERKSGESSDGDSDLSENHEEALSLTDFGLPAHPTSKEQISGQLYDLLALIREIQHAGSVCMIIFVERRITAVLVSQIINSLFGNPHNPFLRADTEDIGIVNQTPVLSLPLTGAEGKDTALDRSNIYGNLKGITNNEVLNKFREGLVQILVATSVAEEGLDIAACKVVVRFNPLVNLVSYLQSRGRARHVDSKYIIMTEKGGKDTIADMQKYEQQMRQIKIDTADTPAMAAFREECSKEVDYLLADEDSMATEYVVASTGAKVTLSSAVSLLHSYCQVLPRDEYSYTAPVFKVDDVGHCMFQCEIQFPLNCPVRQVQSGFHPSKRLAKQYACLEACRQLHKLGSVNDNLIPTAWLEDYAEVRRQEYKLKGKIIVKGIKLDDENRIKAELAAQLEAEGSQQNIGSYPAKSLSWSVVPWDDLRDADVSGFYVYSLTSTMDESINLGLVSKVPLPDSLMSVPYVHDGGIYELKLVFVDTLSFSKSEIRCLQSYFCILLSALLPSSFTSRLLARPSTYSPVMLAPLRAGILPEDTDMVATRNRFIDWHEVDRVVQFAKAGISANLVSNLETKYDSDGLTSFIENHLLISCHQRPTDGGWNFRRMCFVSLIDDVNPGKVHLKRIFRAEVDAATFIKSSKKQDTLEDVLVNRSRPLEEITGATCVVNSTAPSIRTVKRYDPTFATTDSRKGFDEEEAVVLCSKMLSTAGISRDGNEKVDSEYCIETSMRLDNLADFIVPVSKLLVHPIRLSNIKPLLSSALMVFTAEQVLTAHEFRDVLLPQMQNMDLMLAAISCSSAQLPVTYERLETLGDSILKLLVSMFVMNNHPNFHEGQLTTMKSQLICNRHLFNCAVAMGLPKYIISEKFVGRKFLPLGIDDVTSMKGMDPQASKSIHESHHPGLHVGGLENCTEVPMDSVRTIPTIRLLERTLADKTISDVVEAVIGAYYLDRSNSLQMVWSDILCGSFNIIGRKEDRGDLRSTFPRPREMQRSRPADIHDADRALVSSVHSKIGYGFVRGFLLLDAFTHPSFRDEPVDTADWYGVGYSQNSNRHKNPISVNCYQRLEFLGDAVIDFIVMRYLYDYTPHLTPGELSDWKALTVCNEALASCTVRHGLVEYIRYTSELLTEDINEYVKYYNRARSNIDTDVPPKEKAVDSDHMSAQGQKAVAAPKILGDVFEAVVGAMFIDSEFDIEGAVKQFVHKFLIDVVLKPLIEKSSSRKWGPHRHRVSVVDEIRAVVGCAQHWTTFQRLDHQGIVCRYVVHGEILAEGFGSNKKIAELAAAKTLLQENDENISDGASRYVKKLSTLCTCRRTKGMATNSAARNDAEGTATADPDYTEVHVSCDISDSDDEIDGEYIQRWWSSS